ncbi:uncharacterized protein LOC129907606 [Episyrphus balteatus]|uniref:uncharacterized protein LOC129907606 n=1 Tax=Episyrphus balteatus TaxID=286459 RepID=UPI002486004E|nr:uncharacterized protein LOC129907606 [Episyrphus balteatus]
MSECRKEIVIWQKNFFRRTMNIYEPRGPKYRCTQCNEILNTRLSIFTHSKMHLKPFCIVCGLYTQNLDQMQNHMKNFHRELVDIIPIIPKVVKDENHNETEEINSNKKILIDPPKKLKIPKAKKTCFGYNKNKSDKQHLVSRFGRCINVKIPADF